VKQNSDHNICPDGNSIIIPNNNHSGESLIVKPVTIYLPYTNRYSTLHIHSLARYEVRWNVQKNWSKAWVKDDQGNLVHVNSLTTYLYGFWDRGNNR